MTKFCPDHGRFQGRNCPACERIRNRRPRRRARGTYAWKTARAAAQRRDGFRCQQCGLSNRRAVLQVHHIDGNSQNHDLSNLVTLCHACHAKVGGGTPPRETAGRVHPPPSRREKSVGLLGERLENSGTGVDDASWSVA